MSLYKRLHDVQQTPGGGTVTKRRDPVLDELRHKIHHVLIDELGPILYDKRLTEDDLRRRVAALTQRADLLDDSLAANLRIARPEAGEAELWAALAWVGLDAWAESLPRGLQTRVGEGGGQLSAGQARRLALARLYLRDPDLVILDEPFAGLDADTAAALGARLDVWLQGRSVLYLVHQLDGGAFDPPGIDRRVTLVEGRREPRV